MYSIKLKHAKEFINILDGFTLYAVVNELKKSIVNERVEKIYMPSCDEVHFNLRTKNKKLVINVNSGDYRIHVSKYSAKYPQNPPSVCMYLRKFLTNAQIIDVSIEGLERIVKITFISKDEMGSKRIILLYAHLMGRYSNIILTDENNKIMECLKHSSFDESTVYTFLPGFQYVLPENTKLNPLDLTVAQLADIICSQGDKPLYSKLSTTLQGLNNKIANLVIECALPVYTAPVRLSLPEATIAASKLVAFFSDFKNIISIKPHIYIDNSEYSGYCVFDEKTSHVKYFESVNEMLDEYFNFKNIKSELSNKRRSYQKTIERLIAKRQKKLSFQRETLLAAENANVFSKYADLITANLYKLNKNSKEVILEDYYNFLEPITIPLDERFSPALNAQRYYKKYNKLKTAKEITLVNMKSNENEIEFLANLEYSLINCENTDELNEIAFEMNKYGYLDKKKLLRKPESELSEPYKFVSSEGYAIYVGKNSRQNDYLTLHFAHAGDLWLHAKGAGSHVILKLEGKDIPDISLIEAATLAVYFSKQRNSPKADVDYTYRKNIKKPPAAKPGMVIYETYYTLTVKMDEQLVLKLLDTRS